MKWFALCGSLLLFPLFAYSQQLTQQDVDAAALRSLNSVIGSLTIQTEKKGELWLKCEQDKATLKQELEALKKEKVDKEQKEGKSQ